MIMNHYLLYDPLLHSQVINATIETEDGLLVPVKLIDCDSISQAKEKMLDAVFKVYTLHYYHHYLL